MLVLFVAVAACWAEGPDRDPFVRSARLPQTPIVNVPAADGLERDGLADEPAWSESRPYTRLGLDNGQGLLPFPTSVRFLTAGRELWIALDCRIPPDRQGRVVEGAVKGEAVEIWLDNAHTRHSFHHIFLNMSGQFQSPGFSPEAIAAACKAAVRTSPAGYTAELKIDLTRFTQLGPPNARQIGFNIARQCRGGWASLAGMIGQAHKPGQFWTLDLTGQAAQSLPDIAYGRPFKDGADVRKLARGLIEAFTASKLPSDSPHWPILKVRTDRLAALLEKDAASPWPMDGRIEAVTYMTLQSMRRLPGEPSDAVSEAVAQLRPGQPYRPTPWREAAYLSKVDDTAQPYALYVPPRYDPKRGYPLIVYLHGSGNPHFGAGAVFERYSADDDRYLKVRVNARRARRYGEIHIRDVNDVIGEIRRRYHIDPDRLYLTGYSAGGFATFDMATAGPGRFAAVAPVAGACGSGDVAKLRAVPTLIVHGLDDPIVRFEARTKANIAELRAAKPEYLTTRLLPATGHGVPLTGIDEWLLQWKRTGQAADGK